MPLPSRPQAPPTVPVREANNRRPLEAKARLQWTSSDLWPELSIPGVTDVCKSRRMQGVEEDWPVPYPRCGRINGHRRWRSRALRGFRRTVAAEAAHQADRVPAEVSCAEVGLTATQMKACGETVGFQSTGSPATGMASTSMLCKGRQIEPPVDRRRRGVG